MPTSCETLLRAGVVLVPTATEPAAVLWQRCRDGELVRLLGEVYLRADLAAWPPARCAGLAAVARTGWVFGLGTAVWARGGPGRTGPAPASTAGQPVEVLAPPFSASRRPGGVRLRLVALPPAHVEQVHGVPLTGLVRTAADLVLWGGAGDDAALAWLWGRGVDPADVADQLATRGPVPGRSRAARVLRAVRSGREAPLALTPAARRRRPAANTAQPEPRRPVIR